MHGGDGTGGLRGVLEAGRRLGADIVILAGDTFDNHMVNAATVDRAGTRPRRCWRCRSCSCPAITTR